VTDWVAAPHLIWEGIAFLGATRTAVDILVYIAARRAGESASSAWSWEASNAISPKCEPGGTPPTKYDVPEILAIRALGLWFDELNAFATQSIIEAGEPRATASSPVPTRPLSRTACLYNIQFNTAQLAAMPSTCCEEYSQKWCP
jgi:hypothetical protein